MWPLLVTADSCMALWVWSDFSLSEFLSLSAEFLSESAKGRRLSQWTKEKKRAKGKGDPAYLFSFMPFQFKKIFLLFV